MKKLILAVLIAVPAFANNLAGRVVTESSTPLHDAHVYVYEAFPRIGISQICPSCYRDCGKHQEVSAQGAFNITKLDDGLVFNVLAVAPGHEPALIKRVDPARGPLRIELRPRQIADANRVVSGRVLDPNGKPVIGAIVEPSGFRFLSSVGYGNIPGLDKLSITDANGEFALRMPTPDATLDVRVIARSLAPHIERSLEPGKLRTIRLTEGSAISGRVLEGGKPVANAAVRIDHQNHRSSDYLGSTEIATNEDGLFVITNLAANEKYDVSVANEKKVIETCGEKTTSDAGIFRRQ